MKIKLNKIIILAVVVSSAVLFQSCKKDPSVVKVYVRDYDTPTGSSLSGVKVIIIGDVNSNPATLSYVDTVITNGSGYALFNMDDYYASAGKENTVAYFDIIAKTDTKVGEGYIRSRVNTTAVETVYIND